MIPTKNGTNRLIDWDNPEERIGYFQNLRKFLSEIDEAAEPQPADPIFLGGGETIFDRVKNVFKRWNVYFIDVDNIPRVNLDEPRT